MDDNESPNNLEQPPVPVAKVETAWDRWPPPRHRHAHGRGHPRRRIGGLAVVALIAILGGAFAIGRATAASTTTRTIDVVPAGGGPHLVPAPTVPDTPVSPSPPATWPDFPGAVAGLHHGAVPSDAKAREDLANAIGTQAGTQLAGHAPQSIPAASVAAIAARPPAYAAVDRAHSRITFTTTNVAFSVVAVAPGAPDMTFTIGGLTNPTLVVPHDATVTVQFVNADPDQAHGFEVTNPISPVPFRFDQPSITGAAGMPIGDPTSAGDGATTFTFTAAMTGTFEYVCYMPGHAQMGMRGQLIVSG